MLNPVVHTVTTRVQKVKQVWRVLFGRKRLVVLKFRAWNKEQNIKIRGAEANPKSVRDKRQILKQALSPNLKTVSKARIYFKYSWFFWVFYKQMSSHFRQGFRKQNVVTHTCVPCCWHWEWQCVHIRHTSYRICIPVLAVLLH